MDRWQFADRWTLIAGAQFVAADREAKTATSQPVHATDPNDDFSTVNPRVGVIYALNDDDGAVCERQPPVRAADQLRTGGRRAGQRSRSRIRCTAPWWKSARAADTATSARAAVGVGKWMCIRRGFRTRFCRWTIRTRPARVCRPTSTTRFTRASRRSSNFRFALDDSGTHTIAPLRQHQPQRFFVRQRRRVRQQPVAGRPGLCRARRDSVSALERLVCGTDVRLVGERYADFVNSYTVDSYNLLGFRAGWDSDAWRVYAEFHNVLDEHYIATIGVRDVAGARRGNSQPGRTARRLRRRAGAAMSE